MKHFWVVLFVLVVGSVMGQSIGLKVVYQQEKKIEHIKSLALSQKIKVDMIRRAKKEKDRLVLEIRDGVSYFYPITGGMFTQYFKNYDKKQSYIVLDSDIDLEVPYAAKKDFADFGWVVDKDEVETILGYKCYRAESKNGDVVWFTPEVEYPDGPTTYGGLAGMILKVETKYAMTTAVEITKDVQVDFRMPQEFQLISFAKLRQRRRAKH